MAMFEGPPSVSMRFSRRIRKHPRIHPHQPDPERDPLVLVVKDQLLVCQTALDRVLNALDAMNIEPPARLATLFEKLERTGGVEDVHLLQLRLPEGLDIVALTRRLRELDIGDPRKVSPNHVLVPANVGHSCPNGPPSPVQQVGQLPPRTAPLYPVAVIDSGYQWDSGSPITNPLDVLNGGPIPEHEADFLTSTGWEQGAPDRPDADGDTMLDALAGHANFIAGVIAQECPHAQITIWNHNGGFDPASDDFPTEAAVCRSLIKSQQLTQAKVIDVGFAFKSLDHEISCVWKAAFQAIGPDPVVVAPAGNQGIDVPYYPAALNATFPGEYPNLIGVASIDPVAARGGVVQPSTFSNYGEWVTCSAVGSEVVSTFLCIDME